MRRLAFPALLALVLACGTTNTAQRPTNVAPPDIDAELAAEPFFGSGSTAPATIDVRVRNTAAVPITVRRIEVMSPGMNQWGLVRQARVYGEIVQPGETKAITFPGTAYTSTTQRIEPLSFEVVVDFEAGPESARWQQRLRVLSNRPPM